MEEFKKFNEVALPDRRNTYWVLINQETEEQRNYTLEDCYQEVESIKLHEGVPEEIRSQFNTARNLAIYTWFCYPFHQICEMKAFSTLEDAFKKVYGTENLKEKILKDIDSGRFSGAEFSCISDDRKDPDSIKELIEFLYDMRNKLAHGSAMLHPYSLINLRTIADLINQLFNEQEVKTSL